MVQTYTTPDIQIPPDVSNQAATYQLGNATGVYKPRFTNPLVIVGIAVGAIILDIIVLYAILVATGYLFYILIAIPIIALIWMFSALPYANLRAYTFSQGLIHAKGSAIDVIRWDQIEAVWEKATRTRRSNNVSLIYIVRRAGDGKTFRYSSQLQQVAMLGQTIQQELVRAQMPRVIPAYNAEQDIAFGPIHVNTQGLNNGREMVPWTQVGSVVVREGVVNIEQGGRMLPWKSIRADSIPNLAVLRALVNYVVQGQAPQPNTSY